MGWASADAKNNLGTCYEGIGVDSKGMKYYGFYQKNFCEEFDVGDVIRCCIDLSDDHIVTYFKNGRYMGAAYKIPDKYWNKAYFPTINLRGMKI